MEQSDTQPPSAFDVAAFTILNERIRRVELGYVRGFEFRMALDRIVALEESARVTPAEAREREPMCECGHDLDDHLESRGFQTLTVDCRRCDCRTFRPAAPPAPEPTSTVALDPVLMAICTAWRLWKNQDGMREGMVGIQLQHAYRSQAGILEQYDLSREMSLYGAVR